MNTGNFFIELIKRLFSKNPKFFKWLQVAALVLGGISAVLSYLQTQGISLPAGISWLSDAIVKIGALITLILAQLPNNDPAPVPTKETKS